MQKLSGKASMSCALIFLSSRAGRCFKMVACPQLLLFQTRILDGIATQKAEIARQRQYLSLFCLHLGEELLKTFREASQRTVREFPRTVFFRYLSEFVLRIFRGIGFHFFDLCVADFFGIERVRFGFNALKRFLRLTRDYFSLSTFLCQH